MRRSFQILTFFTLAKRENIFGISRSWPEPTKSRPRVRAPPSKQKAPLVYVCICSHVFSQSVAQQQFSSNSTAAAGPLPSYSEALPLSPGTGGLGPTATAAPGGQPATGPPIKPSPTWQYAGKTSPNLIVIPSGPRYKIALVCAPS